MLTHDMFMFIPILRGFILIMRESCGSPSTSSRHRPRPHPPPKVGEDRHLHRRGVTASTDACGWCPRRGVPFCRGRTNTDEPEKLCQNDNPDVPKAKTIRISLNSDSAKTGSAPQHGETSRLGLPTQSMSILHRSSGF